MMKREEAYLFDLFLVPGWLEIFNRLIDDEVKLPREGYFLDLECGTGGLALDLAGQGGEKVNLLGVDSNEELVAIAMDKASIRKSANVRFATPGSVSLNPSTFDLVIVDHSFSPWRRPSLNIDEVSALLRPGGLLVSKLTTAGSFDEFFSIYWEALYELGLTELSPRLESLIAERPTISDAESMTHKAGLRQIHSVVRKEVFSFASAGDLLASPLIRLPFLDHWLGILPDDEIRTRITDRISSIIDRERNGRDFDISIKATIVTGRR